MLRRWVNAVYGLQCMSSAYPEVCDLVRVLAVKVSEYHGSLSAQNVGNALYGLQCMSSEYPEVRDLVRVLAMKVPLCRELLSAQVVGNAVYGL